MPITSKKIIFEYDLDELKAIIIAAQQLDSEECDVDVQFIITTDYGLMDRGPGITMVSGAKVTVTKKVSKGVKQ